MKDKLFSNWGLKLLSLILGFIVWVTVLNVDDYSTTRQIKDIPVTLINTDAITDKNQLYDIVSGETVDIIIKGRRSVVNSLGASDFTAVADMSKLSITNAVNITVTANSPSVNNNISITIVDNVLQVELEEEQTASLPVTVTTKGETAKGYTTGVPVSTPNLITVKGAASVIERIEKAEVQVDVSGRSSDVTATCTPIFYDANGEEISGKKLESKATGILVTVPVYKTKKVAVKIETTGVPAENYKVVNVEYVPNEITVGGPADVLQNQLYDIVSGETVDIIIKGRRSVVNSLGASDFTAVADMSKLSITNAVNITVTANSPSVNNNISITIVDNVLQVELEEEQTASLPVTVTTKGETAKGYTTGVPVSTPNLITVKGAASVIERIEKAEVQVDVSGRSSDVTATCTPIFYDANGEEISGKKLESKATGILVTVPVYKTKKVAVKIETTGVPAENYKVVNVEYVPNEITVGGPADVLQNLTEIKIDDIDVAGCNEDLESTIEVAKYLPEGVVLADENTSISVRVTIERNISRTMTVSAEDITINNKMTDYDYSIQFPEGNTVMISGLSDEVSKLTAKDLKIIVDAETLSVGTNTVELSIEDSDTYTIESTCKVTIEVTAMP